MKTRILTLSILAFVLLSSSMIGFAAAPMSESSFVHPLTTTTGYVFFNESGLPSGTEWSVLYNSLNLSSITTSIKFSETVNILYSYTVHTSYSGVTAYSPSPSSGSAKAPSTVSVSFSGSTFTANLTTNYNPTDEDHKTWYYSIPSGPAPSGSYYVVFPYIDGINTTSMSVSSNGVDYNGYYLWSGTGSHTIYFFYHVSGTSLGFDSSTLSVTVNSDPTVSISASPTTIDYGQSVTFSSTVSGGTSPFTYQWYLNGTAVSGATSSTWTSTSLPTGSPTINVSVTDSAGYIANSNTVSVTVHPVISVTLSSSANPSTVNTQVTFTATASGGSGTYTNFAFYMNSNLEQSGSSDTWSYTFTSIGNYTISVTVTDSLNDQGVADTTQTVGAAPLTVTISASLNPVDVGVTVTFDSFVSGGVPPYTYQWYINGAAVSGAIGSTFAYAFSSPGSYLIGLRVADSSGDPVNAKPGKYPAIIISSTTGTPGESSTPQANVGENFSLNLGYLNDFSGDSFQWELNGTPISGATSPTYTTSEQFPGNYTFTLLIRTGSVTLTGEITEKVTKKIPSYSIEFVESGLPVGAKWNVQIHQGNADWLFQDNMIVNYNQSGQGLPAAIFSPSMMSAFPPGTSFALNGLNGSWEFFVNYGWHNRSLTIINGTYMANLTRGNVTLPGVAANGTIIVYIHFTFVGSTQPNSAIIVTHAYSLSTIVAFSTMKELAIQYKTLPISAKGPTAPVVLAKTSISPASKPALNFTLFIFVSLVAIAAIVSALTIKRANRKKQREKEVLD